MATENKTPQARNKIIRTTVILILLTLLAGTAVIFGPGTVEDSFADSHTTSPSQPSGTALGANDCLIFYTMDSVGGYTVDAIDCPPEGFPDTVTEDMTLEEKALVILPSLEDSLSSK